MSDLQPSKAIYYPHREFASAAWVKSGLLYWERMYRAIGAGLKAQDDPEIHELIEAGLIENISPEPYFERATRMFGERFEEMLRSHNGRLPPSVPALREVRGVEPERAHALKEEYAGKLDALGHRTAAKALREPEPQTRALFMTVLTYVMACERRVAPVTDDPIFDAADTYLEEAKLTQDSKAGSHESKAVFPVDGFAAAQLFVPVPSVDAVASLPVARLIEIREKYAVQRRHFRETIQSRASEIANLPSAEAVRDHLSSFAADIQEDLKGAREAMQASKAKETWSFLGVSAPASLAAGATLAGAANPVLAPIAGFGAIALGVTNWVVQRRKGAQPDEHYLLAVEHAAGGEHGLANALRSFAPA